MPIISKIVLIAIGLLIVFGGYLFIKDRAVFDDVKLGTLKSKVTTGFGLLAVVSGIALIVIVLIN